MNPITIAVKAIRCLQENDFGPGSDEPYVLVTAVDLTTFPPNVEVTRYGPWEDVDTDEVHPTLTEADFKFPFPGLPSPSVLFAASSLSRRPCWYLDNKTGKVINKPEDVIMVVSMMEHDDGSPAGAQAFVKAAAVASLAASINMERSQRVQKLIADIDNVLAGLTSFPDLGFFTPDDRIGSSKELVLQSSDLTQASQSSMETVLEFHGHSGAYRVRFELKNVQTNEQTSDPSAASQGAALISNRGGNLDIIEMPPGTDVFTRSYSHDGGNHWFYNVTLTSENLLQPVNQIGLGTFTSEPAAVVSADGQQVHVFGRGKDNRIWRAFSPNGGSTWTYAWGAIGAGVFTSAPAAAVSADGRQVHVFGRGNDNKIWRAYSPDGGSTWTYAWGPIGAGVFTSAPAAAVSADGRQVHVFGRGNDNKIWRAYSPDGGATWTYAWGPIGIGVFTSAPAAAISADGRQLHVFGRGNDNKIWRAYSPDGGATWTLAWAPIGAGVFTSGPAAAISADGKQLHLIGRGYDNRIWRAYSPDGGGNWTYAWGPIVPQPKVI